MIGERMIGDGRSIISATSERARHHIDRVLAQLCPTWRNNLRSSACGSTMRVSTHYFRLGSCGCKDLPIRRCAWPNAASRKRGRRQASLVVLQRLGQGACPIACLGRRSGRGGALRRNAARPYRAACDALWQRLGSLLLRVWSIAKRGDLDTGLRALRAGLERGRRGRDLCRACCCCSASSRQASAAPVKSPRVSPRSSEAIARSERTRRTLVLPSCLRVKGELFLLQGGPEPRRRPRVTSGRRSTGRAGKARSPGNCAPPGALPGCWAIRAVSPMRRHSSSRSTTGLPKGSTPPTSKRQKPFSMRSQSRPACEFASLDPHSPQKVLPACPEKP